MINKILAKTDIPFSLQGIRRALCRSPTVLVLSGTILKSLFAIILTFKIMRKSALKSRYDSAKIGMVGISALICKYIKRSMYTTRLFPLLNLFHAELKF